MTWTGEKTSRAEIGPVLTFMNIPVSKIHPLNDTTQLIFLFAWGIHNESKFPRNLC